MAWQKRVTGAALAFASALYVILPAGAASSARYGKEDFWVAAQGIVQWKKQETGSAGDNLLEGAFLESAGTTGGDWYPIAMGRMGFKDDYAGYLAVLEAQVEERYREPEKLSGSKATEWHRIALAVLSAGGDPTSFGTDGQGKPIDLIADGTYNRDKTASLGRQGINGWIWGLIALDAKPYSVPESAASTREDMIREILALQLPDGGFALTGDQADPDMTAMALQALAPYREDQTAYAIPNSSGKKERRTPKQAVDEALSCLSKLQQADGEFKSGGFSNLESVSQTIVALCSLGIDPQADSRFIKNGVTPVDVLMRYKQKDGGFTHSLSYDENNPAAVPGESNSMAGEQALCALAALWRQAEGKTALYDFTGEQEKTSLAFTEADKAAVDALPEALTTEQAVQVQKLFKKLRQTGDFPDRQRYLGILSQAKETIDGIQREIDAINALAQEKLYPYETVGLSRKGIVDQVFDRCQALSEYDRSKIAGYEDIRKTKTKLDNQVRAIAVGGILALVAIGLTVGLLLRVRSRRRKKALEMEQLAAQYADESDEE